FFPWRKMLVLGNARMGHRLIAIVHYGATLVIPRILKAFEIQGAIAQPPFTMIKVTVQRSRVEHVIITGGHVSHEDRIQVHINIGMIENALDKRRVAVFGHALKTVKKIIVVIVETYRQ